MALSRWSFCSIWLSTQVFTACDDGKLAVLRLDRAVFYRSRALYAICRGLSFFVVPTVIHAAVFHLCGKRLSKNVTL